MKLRKIKTAIMLIIGWVVFLFGVRMSFSVISNSNPLQVKILYDFSGSMYPGYPFIKLYESGTKFFYQYDHFRQWMGSFIREQTRFNGNLISMYFFHSMGPFRSGDIMQVHPPMEISRFQIEKAFSREHPLGVDYSLLAESLDEATKNGFEGLVWMITDNRVESINGGETTRRFFETLKITEKYRSVHIYKYPFVDPTNRQQANLAIYGILVSPNEILNSVSSWYDKKFAEFKDFFPQAQHLKLKDLSINPISIDMNPLTVDVQSSTGNFTEGKIITLAFSGMIKSNLTQHTIKGGNLKIKIKGMFEPDEKSKGYYGIQNIPGDNFREVDFPLTEEIPPNSEEELKRFSIRSIKPLSISMSNFFNRINATITGLKVNFSGVGEVSSDGIEIALKEEGREKITGIYSCNDIGTVFGSQTSITEIRANPTEFPLNFRLHIAPYWIAILFLILFLIVLPICFLIYRLTRGEIYRIKTEKKNETINLRRLGSYAIQQDGMLLGILTRGMGNIDTFTPNTALAVLKLSPGKKNNEYNISINNKEDKKFFILTVEPVNPSRVMQQKNNANEGFKPRGNRPVSSNPIPGSVSKTAPSVGKTSGPGVAPSSPTGSRPKITIPRPK